MTAVAEPTGTVATALEHAKRLLRTDPLLAAEQAGEILKVAPSHPVASLLLGVARRAAGDSLAALAVLETLVAEQPRWAAAHYELGITLGALDRRDEALAALRGAVALKPDMPDAWREIGDLLTLRGDSAGADWAYARHIKASTHDPRLMSAAHALCENQLAQAELLLREHLKQYPTDVAAIRMFAEVAGRLGRNRDAENLLARCLELAPSFNAARYNYALALHRQNKSAAALLQVDKLTASEPRNSGYRNLKAVVLANIGEYRESLEIYADVLAKHPDQWNIWTSYGYALSAAGRLEESIAAHRRCIDLAPGFGEAYYGLANLKTFRFTEADLENMRAQLANPATTPENRAPLHFAVGKALEDLKQFAESFEHYAEGNRLRLAQVGYESADTTAQVQRSKALFTKEFFSNRAGFGTTIADPIFIVGLPRAGSTLIEQILASHSSVEGTMELSNVMALAAELGGKGVRPRESAYPEALAVLSDAECAALGERYIEETRIQRKTGKTFFIDKMPNNFLHIGLIHLALPNAKIIDARRHPMACCFSGFKQYFAQGQRYTYSLEDIGRYYRDYVDLMAHFDAVLPGKVHRVIYEQMIEGTETEVRRLLEFCQLPFEAACLRFYDNERAVRTASAQQVRKPIFRESIDHWRNYEPWLAPLRCALGEVLEDYPHAP